MPSGLTRWVDTGFPKRSCSTKDPERDVDSTSNDRALVTTLSGGERSMAGLEAWDARRSPVPPPNPGCPRVAAIGQPLSLSLFVLVGACRDESLEPGTQNVINE
jgi:hypothetical protein